MIQSHSTTTAIRVEHYRADWLRLPLQRPYKVAYRPIEVFDIFLTTARFSDGSTGYGEACPVPGYTDDTAESIWSGLQAHVRRMRGLDRESATRQFAGKLDDQPFLLAALLSPLEWRDAVEPCPDTLSVPLIGTVLGSTDAETQDDVVALLDAGYRTLKVKVGWDVAKDLEHVAIVQEAIRRHSATQRGPVYVRIDANQGYTFEQTQAFLAGLNPEFIQLFEQPIGDEQWDVMKRITDSPVPLMLDEWITDEESIEKAARLPSVRFVKFKLMKAGGFARLAQLIAAAREAEFNVILGNGVAGDVGCLSEAVAAWRLGIDLAGEMNGFLKPRQRITPALTVNDGKLIARPKALTLDESVMSNVRIDALHA